MSGLNNLGDDVVGEVVNGADKALHAIIAIISAIEQYRKNSLELGILKQQLATSESKIAFGRMSEAEYKAFSDSAEMNIQCVPKESLRYIEDYSKKVGAKYFVIEDNNSEMATVAVPSKYTQQFNEVIKCTISEQMRNNENSFITNSNNLVKAEDVSVLDDVLNSCMIPVYKFDVGNDRMNVVPKEFEGQYNAAVEAAKTLKDKLNFVDIDFYNQTSPLDELDYRIAKINPEKADAVFAALGEKVEFLKDDDNLMCKFPKEIEEEYQNIIENYDASTKEAEDYLIGIVGSDITMNVGLIESQSEDEYLFRVPNTAAKDYIKLNKTDITELDGGKTFGYKIDFEKKYQIYDKDGTAREFVTGEELAQNYNTKNLLGNAHTEVSHHFNDNLERIELYNASKNTMMRIGIRSAEEIESVLVSNGLTAAAAHKLCQDIDKSLPEQYKETFNYSEDKHRYTVAPETENTKEMIKQAQIAETTKDSECVFNSDNNGDKCCIHDKENKQFIIVDNNESKDKIIEHLTAEMGYSNLQANCIADIAMRTKDNTFKIAESEVMSFKTTNPEVSKLRYLANEHAVVIAKPDIVDDKPELKNIAIKNGANRSEIEKALIERLEIKDPASVAETMKCLDDNNLIEKAKEVQFKIEKQAYTVSKLSKDYIIINGNTVSKNLTTEEMSKALAVDNKTADAIKKSVDKVLDSSKMSSLTKIKTVAEQTIKSIETSGKAIIENTIEKTTKTFERIR